MKQIAIANTLPVLIPLHVRNEGLHQPILPTGLLDDALCCHEQLLRIMQGFREI